MIQGQSYAWTDLLKVADEAGFTPLPIGEYDAVVASATAQQTSNGKDCIVVQLQVSAGPEQGRKIRNQFTISPDNPNAIGFFFRHMGALGLNREYFQQAPSLAQVAQAILNRPCRIKVSHRDWNGQTRDNVDAIMPPAYPTVGPVPAAPGGPAITPAPLPPTPVTGTIAPPPPVTASPVDAPPVPVTDHPGGLDAFTAPVTDTPPVTPPTTIAPPKLPF